MAARSRPTAALRELTIAVADPSTDDIAALLLVHTSAARAETPPEDAHALDAAGLIDPSVTFFAVRRAGRLLAIGAIRELTHEHAELKSMHTAAAARRQGVGRALLDHLLSVARRRGYQRVFIETGSHPMFAPARALYARAGFLETPPFAHYRESPHNVYMALDLRGG